MRRSASSRLSSSSFVKHFHFSHGSSLQVSRFIEDPPDEMISRKRILYNSCRNISQCMALDLFDDDVWYEIESLVRVSPGDEN